MLVDDTVVAYKVDRPYAPSYERGIRWDDPMLAIDWLYRASILSEKDRMHPTLAEDVQHFGGERE